MFIIAKYALTLTGVVFNFMIPLLQRKVRAIICFGKKKKKKSNFIISNLQLFFII